MTVVVITPIEEEFDALSGAFGERWLDVTERHVGRISTRAYNGHMVLLARGGLGKVQFALQTQHPLERLESVDLVVCAGVAGALVETSSVNDVVVATATVEHDFNWKSKTKHKSRLPEFPGSTSHIAALRQTSANVEGPFGVLFGPVASGDEAILESKRAREMHDRTGALAVAWEGAGGARAARLSNVPYLELRGISDKADEEAASVWAENVPSAIRNVAVVIDSLVRIVDRESR